MKHQINVRVTAIVLQEDKILLVKQKVGKRAWSLPGGSLEPSETIQDALIRELLEETGLTIQVDRLLYVTEKPENSLVHLSFLCRYLSGEIELPTNEFDQNPISDVRFVAVDDLCNYGFTAKFRSIVQERFPQKGHYLGGKGEIGL